MISRWETQEERLRKFMRISPKKKLEWLYQMNEFVRKFSFKKQEIVRPRFK